MNNLKRAARRIRDDESGHVTVGVPSLTGAIGAILLAVGAAGDTDWPTITGGIILGLGLVGSVSPQGHRLRRL